MTEQVTEEKPTEEKPKDGGEVLKELLGMILSGVRERAEKRAEEISDDLADMTAEYLRFARVTGPTIAITIMKERILSSTVCRTWLAEHLSVAISCLAADYLESLEKAEGKPCNGEHAEDDGEEKADDEKAEPEPEARPE